MKSNQEQRSNECLPPKKRELAAASTLASEEQQRPAVAVMAPATDSQRTENLAWLASVAGGPEGTTRHRGESEGGGARYKPLQCSMPSDSFSSSSSSLRLVTSLPAVYTSPVVSQSGAVVAGGAIHYTQLPPNLQFIASPYPSAPYAGYISSISSQLLPPPPPPPPAAPPLSSSSSSSSSYLPLQRPSSHVAAEMAFASPPPPPPSSTPPSSQTSKFDQQRASLQARTSMPPPSTDAAPLLLHHHHHHHAAPPPPPRTVLSPHHHHHPHHHQGAPLHPHHTLGTQGMSHVVLQYADGPPPSRKEDGGGPRPSPLNGEVERGGGRRGCFESGLLLSSKAGSKPRHDGLSVCSSSSPAYQMAPPPPSDYATHDPSGARTSSSVMLMPNSHVVGDNNKRPAPPSSAPTHLEKGVGKPVSRTTSSSSSSFAFASPLSVVDGLKAAVATVSPHTVIHATHSATEPFSVGFPSYPQPPLIGYLAGGQQQPMGYQTGLPPQQHHLLIPGAQQVIIPVSGSGGSAAAAALESSSSSSSHHHHHVTVSSAQCSPFPAALPQHAYITTKGEATVPVPEGVPYPHQHLLHQHHHAPSSSGAVIHLPLVAAASAAASAQAPPPSTTTTTTTTPSMPPYFIAGSIIQLADGELKRVEELKTEDFIQSAEVSAELKIDSSTVERIDGSHSSPNFAVVQFSVGEHRAQVCVEVLVEYPFFVFGQGWSSCCPDRTTQLLELPCTKLSVGDVCISLTLKNLKNGSLKKTQTFELVTPASSSGGGHHGFLKPPRAAPDASSTRTHSGGGGNSSRHGERANGVGQRGSAVGAENGELGFEEERGSVSRGQQGATSNAAEEASARKPAAATSRKRRWSAPEGRKVEKTEEEPPLVLPKPSFIPHRMKVSIEGRSNIGK